MKITKQNMVISLAAGVLAFGITAPLLKDFSLFVGPAVAIGLWAYFSKKESGES